VDSGVNRFHKVDGLEVENELKMLEMASRCDAMLLTIERPPKKAHKTLLALEKQGNSAVVGQCDPELRSSFANLLNAEDLLTTPGHTEVQVVISHDIGEDVGILVRHDKHMIEHVVTYVKAGSVADKVGVRVNDWIVQVDGKTLTTSFERLMASKMYKKKKNNFVMKLARGSSSEMRVSQHLVFADL